MKKKIIIIVAIVLILAIGIGIALYYLLNPLHRALSYIDKGDYENAVAVYEDKIKRSDSKSEFRKKYKEYLNDCKTAFYEEKMSYEEIVNVLSHVHEFGMESLDELAIEIIDYTERINTSRSNWKTAEELYNQQLYAEAMNYYSSVINEDSYYEAAVAKYSESINLYRNLVLSQAQTFADKAEYDNALKILEEAIEVLENDSELSTKLVLYTSLGDEKAINDAYAKAEEHYNQGEYDSAIEVLNEIMSQYQDSNLTILFDKCVAAREEKIITEALAKAESYYNEGDYNSALDVLGNVMYEYHDKRLSEMYAKCTEALKEDTVKETLTSAEKSFKDGDYGSALSILKSCGYFDDKRVSDKYNDYYRSVRDEYLDNAASKFKKEGYQSAINVLKEGQTILGNDADLAAQIAEYEEYKPVNLFTLEYFNASSTVDVVRGPYSETDNLGEIHYESYTLSDAMHSNAWATYRVGGKYTELTGSFYLLFKNRATTTDHVLSIYGDDKLLFTTTITGGVGPVDFSVDISGVDYLKISYTTYASSNSFPSRLASLSDVYLCRQAMD